MVRVISAHHFDSQIVQTCEEPLAVATSPPDRLLIALSHHVIEVKDLSDEGKTIQTFPTVDRVSVLLHCTAGNYVATLEHKSSLPHSNDHKDGFPYFLRVYTNWEHCDSSGIRARIAGRVTPSSSQSEGELLEMIELPNRFQHITTIACSQETGNILAGSKRILSLYQRVTRTHDISRLKFLDFELWPVTLELSFSPVRLAMCEDLVAASNAESLHVFRINKGFARPSDWTTLASSSANSSPRKNAKECSKDFYKTGSHTDLLLGEACKNIISSSGLLSTLSSIRCSLRNNNPELRVPPFKPPASVLMGVTIRESPANEPWAEQMTSMVESLLQLELWEAEGDKTKDIIECVSLRPLYITKTSSPSKQETSCPRLRSASYNLLVAFNCLVCTRLQGFMYHFPVDGGSVTSTGKCISEYNFTSPVKHIVLQPYLLHAVTQTGLETYTLRSIHAVEEDHHEAICPSVNDPVCQIGLRPFFGVVKLFLTNSFVVILSSSCDSNSNETTLQTIYSLRLSSAGTIYTDILATASLHTFTSPSIYCQLLSEAHALLRTAITVTDRAEWDCRQVDICDAELYRESCALLAEYYLSRASEDEWNVGYEYCQLANLEPSQVIERLKRIEKEAKQCGFPLDTSPGLTFYLRNWILNCGDDSNKLTASALSELQNLATCSTMEGRGCLLSSLVLQSPLLRQFSVDSTIRIIMEHINGSEDVSPLDCVALSVLYSSKGKTNEAGNALILSSPDSSSYMVSLLIRYWSLLFDSTKNKNQVSREDWEGVTLSDLSVLLIEKRPQEIAETLKLLVVQEETLQLQHVLQVFLTYLPARMCSGTSGIAVVLQSFLEKVFNGFLEKNIIWNPNTDADPAAASALKILMRSLLSDLVRNDRTSKENTKWEEAECYFGGNRFQYLDLLPPLSYEHCDKSKYVGLLKLQCLLCTNWLEETSLSELVQFVEEFVPSEVGYSLLVAAQPRKAVELLAADYPKVLPQYTKDVLKSEPELKHIIATLQSKADEEEVEESEDNKKLYPQILDEVIEAIASSVPCDVFTRIVPADVQQYTSAECRDTVAHSTHLSDVIKATGHRMMASLNIKSFT